MNIELILVSMPLLLKGLYVTVYMSFFSTLFATILGGAIALLQIFGGKYVRYVIETFLYLIRGVPLLVLLFTMYYSLQYAGVSIEPNLGGIVVIGVYFAAFMAEIFRGSLLAIPRSQWEAGLALGMRTRQLLLQVLLPQTLKMVGAPYINIVVMVVKGTSLVAVIGVADLTYAGRQIVERTLAPFEIFGVVAIFYIVLCYLLSSFGRYLERKVKYAS